MLFYRGRKEIVLFISLFSLRVSVPRCPSSPCLASTTPGFITATASEVERDPAWTKADRRGSTSRSGSESSCASSESEPTARDSPISTGETAAF